MNREPQDYHKVSPKIEPKVPFHVSHKTVYSEVAVNELHKGRKPLCLQLLFSLLSHSLLCRFVRTQRTGMGSKNRMNMVGPVIHPRLTDDVYRKVAVWCTKKAATEYATAVGFKPRDVFKIYAGSENMTFVQWIVRDDAGMAIADNQAS